MTFLELVQKAMSEAGITQTDAVPNSLQNLTGLAAKFKVWTHDAWEDVKIENDQDEFVRAWFSATVNPRFYFDLPSAGLEQVFAGDTLIGQYSGCTFVVTNIIVVNGGLWVDGTAQGQIEFSNATGVPMDSEPLLIQGTSNVGLRWIKWGDYRLDDQTEMGVNYISNLEDVWWQTLKIADNASNPSPNIQERALPFIDYSQWSQCFDVNVITLGTPRFVTETPDDGTRIAFFPPCDRPYRLSGYYYKTVPELIEDDDVPEGLKSLYHPMIAWRALRYYAEYEQQAGILAQATRRYLSFKKKLDRECELPVVMVPRRLY